MNENKDCRARVSSLSIYYHIPSKGSSSHLIPGGKKGSSHASFPVPAAPAAAAPAAPAVASPQTYSNSSRITVKSSSYA